MQRTRESATKLGLITLLLLAWAAQAGATPITTFSDPFHSRTNISTNSVGLPAGDQQWISIQASPTAGTTVTASQNGVIRPLSFTPYTRNLNSFWSIEPFDASLGGSWAITATNGPDSAGPVGTNFMFDPQLVPLALNPQVVGTGATPTLTWGVPDLTGTYVDTTQIAVWNDATNDWFYFSDQLPGTPTQFTIPSGVLFPGVPYVFVVGLGGTTFLGSQNGSLSFTHFAYFVPEPTTAILLGLGLSGLAVSGRGRGGEAKRRGGRVR